MMWMEEEARPPRMSQKEVCPELGDLAAFIDGCLSLAERRPIIVHLNRCRLCYEVFVETLRASAPVTSR